MKRPDPWDFHGLVTLLVWLLIAAGAVFFLGRQYQLW